MIFVDRAVNVEYPFQQEGISEFTGGGEQEFHEKAAGLKPEIFQLIIVGCGYLFQQFRHVQEDAGFADMQVLRQKQRVGGHIPDGAFVGLQRGKTAGEGFVFYGIGRRMTFLQLFLIEMDIKIGTGSSFCPPVFQAGIQNEHVAGFQMIVPFPFLQIHITGKKEIQDIFFQLAPDMDMGGST